MKSARFEERYGQFQLLFVRLRGRCLGRVMLNNKEVYDTIGPTYEFICSDMKAWINSNPKAKDLIKSFRKEMVSRCSIVAQHKGIDIRASVVAEIAIAVGMLRDKRLFAVEAASIEEAINLIKNDVDQNKSLIDRTIRQNHQNVLKKFGVPAFSEIQCVEANQVDNLRSTHC